MSRIGPGTAGTVKAFRLVHRQQCSGAFELDALLAQRSRSGVQRSPAAGGRRIGCEPRLVSRFVISVVGRGVGRLIAHNCYPFTDYRRWC